jgi:hypothetical protein
MVSRYAYSDSDLAVTTSDGRLVIYDSVLATVKNEFVPTSHLSSACTCVAWKPKSVAGAEENGHLTKSVKK